MLGPRVHPAFFRISTTLAKSRELLATPPLFPPMLLISSAEMDTLRLRLRLSEEGSKDRDRDRSRDTLLCIGARSASVKVDLEAFRLSLSFGFGGAGSSSSDVRPCGSTWTSLALNAV